MQPRTDQSSLIPVKVLEWTPKYSVYVAKLDQEHQIQFDFVNRLHEAMLVGKGATLLRTLSVEIVKHTLDHHVHEEALMAKVYYPGFRDHVQQHEQLRHNGMALAARVERGETTLTIEVILFLSYWIKQHIMTADRPMGEYLSTSRGTRRECQGVLI